MDKFLIKRPRSEESSNTHKVPLDSKSSKKNINTNFNNNGIVNFDIGIRYQVRREYLTRCPCQPICHNFPRKDYGKQKRRSRIGEDTFTKMRFNNWKKALEKFVEHIGAINRFQSQRQSVSHYLVAHSHEMAVAYHIRLIAILDVTHFLLKQGNFLELLEWYSLRNEEVWKIVNQNGPRNNQLTSPKIQKELANACATEITCVIVDDIGINYFSLMIDEARDALVKQQMGVNTIDCLFAKHKLSLSRLRGQGYNGASNMQGEFNGLKALILRENPCAKYLISMWTSILEVLQNVHDDGASNNNRGIVTSLIDKIENYKFVFVMYLVRHLLGMTNELSLALQQKDQNIVQSMRLMKGEFLGEVTSFCKGNSIDVPNMEDNMPIRGHSRREGQFITHFHHYHVEIFCEIIDLISEEMLNHFPKASAELLLLVSCLDPRDSFSKFNIHKLLRLAEIYPEDFSVTERMILEDQLATFIYDMWHDDDFANVGDLGDFVMKMVDTGKCTIFALIYRLIDLVLVLPVATANVERVFSAMNIVKTNLRNKMGDKWMNNSIIVYIEKEVFATIDNEAILQCFKKIQTRRIQLPPLSSMRRTDGSSSLSVHR
ncbi:Ribonuclease H-like protein [Dioscorea alata]|uniref:Ribonuclease H-like protein n=1 Tax=Dioscorea alata TaxID=55571 RepID=A0ACB7VSK1_DIOAL|nr:Ribonuclease H-like protein [Dioscorea alata]